MASPPSGQDGSNKRRLVAAILVIALLLTTFSGVIFSLVMGVAGLFS